MTDWAGELIRLRAKGQPFAVVTVTAVSGSGPREPGAKMLVRADRSIWGTIGGGNLEHQAIQDAQTVIANGQAKVERYPLGAKTGQCCGGTMDLFFEPMNHGPRLYLFGAGHVAQAVCRILEGTPFLVHVIDDRETWVQSPVLSDAVIRHECEWDEFVREAIWDADRTYVAVMTYRHDTDQAIIEKVSELPAKYIGLIGSEAKWSRFQQRMEAKGISGERINRVKCPLGLPTGGKSPSEVAISLAAELLQKYHGVAGEHSGS
ncbi:MAG: xanthine dehydrogenase accessory protein XdhC [Bacteriovoracia bacterium]